MFQLSLLPAQNVSDVPSRHLPRPTARPLSFTEIENTPPPTHFHSPDRLTEALKSLKTVLNHTEHGTHW